MVLKNLGMSNTSLGFTAGFTGNEIKRLLGDKGVMPVEILSEVVIELQNIS